MSLIESDRACHDALDALLSTAKAKRSSDIHIEPHADGLRIRLRTDGLLHPLDSDFIKPALLPRISARIKAISGLDIGDARIPQDGRWRAREHQLDIRVSSLPCHNGEKIVLRLFSDTAGLLTLDELSNDAQHREIFNHLLTLREGIILASGPTGSGKTTTLYAMLSALNHNEVNIVSAENPIERQIPGLNQVEINQRAGRDFATVLRAFLRQDPDIMLIGEIRDEVSATIALRAAQTGHLVLASVHANDFATTRARLIGLGAQPNDLNHAIKGIINQRLVRKLCQRDHSISDEKKCSRCTGGYFGRVAVYEFETVFDHQPTSLFDSARKLITTGTTTHRECIRVLGSFELTAQ